jgi:hypothetical protein
VVNKNVKRLLTNYVMHVNPDKMVAVAICHSG